MIRAAASGRLNFENADSSNVLWLLRERLVIDELERDSLLQLTACRHLQQAATTVWPAGDEKGAIYNTHIKSSERYVKTMGRLLFPYVSLDDKTYYRSEVEQLKAEYAAKFGDPSSPEAKARAKADEEALKKQQLMTAQRVQSEAIEKDRREKEIQRLRLKRMSHTR